MFVGRASATTGARPRRRRLPLRAYFLLLVSLFVLAAGVTAAYVAIQSNRDARAHAVKDAAFAAQASAKQLGIFVGALKATTKSVATSPHIERVLIQSKGCSLSFSGIGGSDKGHIDIIRADGVVLCSSREAHVGAPYAASPWLRRARRGQIFVPVATDAATGAHVFLSASPIAGGKAVVAAFGDLVAVGPSLASSYGGGKPSEFLVTSADGKTVLARSINPLHWVGRSLSGTTFAQAGNAVERRDLNGVTRLYASAPVAGVGWHFYVGESKHATMASDARLKRRQLVVVLVGLLFSLLVAWLVYRRIVAPIRQLSSALRGKSGAVLVPVPTGGPAEIIDLSEDINRLTSSLERELNERLESEARYRDLFENASDLIAVVDLEGRIVNANGAFGTAIGHDRDGLIGMSFPELVPPSPEGDPVAAGTTTTLYERELVAADESRIQVEIASRVIEKDGEPVGFEAICRDTTPRKLLEEQLRQAQRLESVGRLAGGVAHDFNNLLTVISGYTDMLLAGHASSEGRELSEIASAAERAANLTRQLLAFSRQQVLQPRVLDVNEVVEGIMPMLSRLIGEDVHIIEQLAPSVHPVVADPTQLEQVIVNLVVNARDAMPEGGTLAIETSNVRLDESYLAHHPEAQVGPNVMLAVSDTGTGMDAETLARAFEPFFSTKPIGAGTGLGLATVHGIVKQSGGSIWAYSEPGIGTTFKIYFPMSTEAAAYAPEEPHSAAPAVGTETILIAEDEDTLRPLLARMLEEHGYTTIVAGTGREAVDIIQRGDAQVDLLLTDLVMPDMNGRDLADRVQQEQDGVRVLFMSGYAGDTATRNGALDIGAAFLEKPFSADDLARKVRETLDHATASA
jgi:PAS domain S-box-containing protein